MLTIREERQADLAHIETLNRAAFGGPDEAVIVDRLRQEGLTVLSLVAEREGRIIGHILFSRLAVEVDGQPVAAAALAPMAVAPDCQNQGIGSALVREGLRLLRDGQTDAVIVVGHPAYYPRFGFRAETARLLASPYAGEVFMALELRQGVLNGSSGKVIYPSAFDGDDPAAPRNGTEPKGKRLWCSSTERARDQYEIPAAAHHHL